MGSVDFNTVEDSQPNGGTGKVNGSTVHVDCGTKRNNKTGNGIGDLATGLDALEGHGNRGSRRCTSKRHGLSRHDVFQVRDGICASKEEVDSNVSKDDVHEHGQHGGNDEISDILKGVSQVFLPTDCFDNETKDSNCVYRDG